MAWEQMMKVYLDPHEVECIEEQATCIRDRLLIRLLFRLGCTIWTIVHLWPEPAEAHSETAMARVA
jgi:hypothetical protein